jgi:carbamoyltransferase
MGVSIGAGALLVSYLTGRFPCNDQENLISPAFPPRPDIFTRKLPQSLTPMELEDPLGFYAAQLLDGKIFCHVEDESEVGPRALGHRSIIAHAANDLVRDRINRCKGREMWRPLAPIVRACDVTRFFAGPDAGEMSRFMLSTYRVVNPQQLPAVTHVDHTARTQMVEDGTISDLLDRLSEISEIPVIVNTSFNVAGEPLVETYTEAVSSFECLGFDYLYIDGKVYQNS